MAGDNIAELMLFGGSKTWNCHDWTSSDDSVRGGDSHSTMTISQDGSSAIFSGLLDVRKLGGAGFASQRTANDDEIWDIRGFSHLSLSLKSEESDDRVYTVYLKNEIAKLANGREQSTTSWEADFKISAAHGNDDVMTISIAIKEFIPFYRGRQIGTGEDRPQLNKNKIRRIGVMCKSHFGAQSGNFTLTLLSIGAIGHSHPKGILQKAQSSPGPHYKYQTFGQSGDSEGCQIVDDDDDQSISSMLARHWQWVMLLLLVTVCLMGLGIVVVLAIRATDISFDLAIRLDGTR